MIELTLKRSLFAVALAGGIVSGCGDVSDTSPTPEVSPTPTVTNMFSPVVDCVAGASETEDVLYLGLDTDTKLNSVTVEIYDWGYGDCSSGGTDTCWTEDHTLELDYYGGEGADYVENWLRELGMATSGGAVSASTWESDVNSIFKCEIALDAATTYVYTITVEETLEETCLAVGTNSATWAPNCTVATFE